MIRVVVYKPSDRRYYIARWKDSKGRTRKRSTKQTRRRAAERFAAEFEAELQEAEERANSKATKNKEGKFRAIPLGTFARLTDVARTLEFGPKTIKRLKDAGLPIVVVANADYIDTCEFVEFLRNLPG